MATPPLKLRPLNKSDDSDNYTIFVIPGITKVNLYFNLIDYYENNVSTLTGR